MKTRILIKFCFGILLTIQDIRADDRAAVYYCTEDQGVFLTSDGNERTMLEQFVLRVTDQVAEVINDGYFKDGYTFPFKEFPNAQGGVTAGFGGHTFIFVKPHFFYLFNFMGSEKSQMATIFMGRCDVF